VPVFLTTKVTSPAGAVAGEAVRVIGPPAPLVSLTVTFTVVLLAVGPVDVGAFGILTPPSKVSAPVEPGLLAHPARAPRVANNARPAIVRCPRRTCLPLSPTRTRLARRSSTVGCGDDIVRSNRPSKEDSGIAVARIL